MAYRNIHYDRDAILEAIRDGQTYGEISAAHNVSRQVVSRLAVTHGLRRQDNRGPERPCDGCGIRIWGDKALCKPCQDFYADRPASEALSGGQWVLDPVRRIQVWRGSEPPDPPTPIRSQLTAEESEFGDAEAKRARLAYERGDTSAWAITGNRVYWRRLRRARRARGAA